MHMAYMTFHDLVLMGGCFVVFTYCGYIIGYSVAANKFTAPKSKKE